MSKWEQGGKYALAFSAGWCAMALVAAKFMVEEQKKWDATNNKIIKMYKDGYEWYLEKAAIRLKHINLLTNAVDPELLLSIHQEMEADYVYHDANAPETVSNILTELAEERANDGDA